MLRSSSGYSYSDLFFGISPLSITWGQATNSEFVFYFQKSKDLFIKICKSFMYMSPHKLR